jgi:hypothetical protein
VVGVRGDDGPAGAGRSDHGTAGDTGYIVSCWRRRLRTCRGFATLGEARAAATQHVRDAAEGFTDDQQLMVDRGFLAAAAWALRAEPEPDLPAACDLADGTKIRVRVVSAATARCLSS